MSRTVLSLQSGGEVVVIVVVVVIATLAMAELDLTVVSELLLARLSRVARLRLI